MNVENITTTEAIKPCEYIHIHDLHAYPEIQIHKWNDTHALHIRSKNCLLETDELIRLASGAHMLSQIIQQYLFQLTE